MFSADEVELIVKTKQKGGNPRCPSCNASLLIRDTWHDPDQGGAGYRSRTFSVKCPNCGEYGEITFNF